MISRRSILGTFWFAPAIVHSGNLMPIKSWQKLEESTISVREVIEREIVPNPLYAEVWEIITENGVDRLGKFKGYLDINSG